MPNLHVSLYQHQTGQIQPVRQGFRHSVLVWDPIRVKGSRGIRVKPCRSFRSEEGEEMKGNRVGIECKKGVNPLLHAIRSTVWSLSKPRSKSDARFREALEKLEEKLSKVKSHMYYLRKKKKIISSWFFEIIRFVVEWGMWKCFTKLWSLSNWQVAVQIARYIVTMTSTGAVLLTGFQLSGLPPLSAFCSPVEGFIGIGLSDEPLILVLILWRWGWADECFDMVQLAWRDRHWYYDWFEYGLGGSK